MTVIDAADRFKTEWQVWREVCTYCAHRIVGVIGLHPGEEPPWPMQCPKCRNRTVWPEHYERAEDAK